MGGRQSGEVASKLCVDILRKHFHYYAPRTPADAGWEEVKRSITMITTLLHDWVRKINAEINQMGRQASKKGNMGTTVVLLYLHHNFGVVGHVGDSRLYRFREDEGLTPVTEDHSLVNQQLRRNQITAEEALASSQRNIVTRALGTRPDVEPEIQVIEVEDGDIFLLCSDGLTDLVVDEEIGSVLHNNLENLDMAVKNLIDLANARGGKDNITIVIAQAFDLPG